MNNAAKIIIVILVLVILYLIYYYNKAKTISNGQEKILSFKVATSPVPDEFGPSYWKAFHGLAHDVPCPGCRGFAEKFIIFFHDIVNLKTGKQLYDPQNYNEMQTLLQQIRANNNTYPQSIVPQH